MCVFFSIKEKKGCLGFFCRRVLGKIFKAGRKKRFVLTVALPLLLRTRACNHVVRETPTEGARPPEFGRNSDLVFPSSFL